MTTAPTCPVHVGRPMIEFKNDDGTSKWKCSYRTGTKPDGKGIFCRESWRPTTTSPPGPGWTPPRGEIKPGEPQGVAEIIPRPTLESGPAIEAENRRTAVEAASRIYQGSANGDTAFMWAERFLEFLEVKSGQ